MTELLIRPTKSLWWYFRQQLDWRDTLSTLLFSAAITYNQVTDGPLPTSLILLFVIAAILALSLLTAIYARRHDRYIAERRTLSTDSTYQSSRLGQ